MERTKQTGVWRLKLDIRLTTLTFVAWMILLPTFSLIHELGHGLVCDYYGFEPNYHLTLLVNAVTCTGNFSENPGSQTSFRMAGGFLAASLAFIVFACVKSVPKLKFLSIALVVIGVTQFFNMTMETYAHEFYINDSQIMTMANTLGAMIMLFFLIQRNTVQKPSIKEIAMKVQGVGNTEEVPQSVFQRSIVDIIKRKKPTEIQRNETFIPTEDVTFASLDLLNEQEDEEEEED